MSTPMDPSPPPDAAAGAVLRVWRGTAAPERVPVYLQHLRTRVEPALTALDGYLGVAVLTRPVQELVEIVVMTRWRSLDHVAAFAGPDLEGAVVEAEARAVLTDYDTFVRHFTVVHEAVRD
jgi:heme-degrading monooxygenase HmoA